MEASVEVGDQPGGLCYCPGVRRRGLDQSGCDGGGELSSDAGYIFKIALVGFADGVDVRCERIQDDAKVFSLEEWSCHFMKQGTLNHSSLVGWEGG